MLKYARSEQNIHAYWRLKVLDEASSLVSNANVKTEHRAAVFAAREIF